MSESLPSDLNTWRFGYPLETAWAAFAEPRERQRYHQVATDEGLRLSQYMLMLENLWQRLSSGELTAYGWRVNPTPSTGPVPIPHVMFDSPPLKSNLDISRFVFHSWTFDNVKVAGSHHASIAHETADVSKDETDASALKRGRKSHSSKFKIACSKLVASDLLFTQRPQETQIREIQLETKRLFPAEFPGESLPGRSTVARFVQGWRKVGWSEPDNPENTENP